MERLHTSRREFIVGTAATLLASRVAHGQRGTVTAQQIADRIKSNVGVAWRAQTVDGFKAGDPSTPVTGIAVTVMATTDVLRRAAAAGQNFIITQEPIFYAANDDPGNRASDPVYLAKKAVIDELHLVVFRFAEHWNARQPNESAKALAATLKWSGELPDTPQTYRVPDTTLAGLAAQVRGRLPIRGGLRMVGQPNMRVRTVFLAPGTTSLAMAVTSLQHADVILAGEPREWEAVPVHARHLVGRSRQGSDRARADGVRRARYTGVRGLRSLARAGGARRVDIGDRPLLERQRMTAEQIVARMQKKLQEVGVTWRTQTVDTFKAGRPETEIKAIATTGMSTFDVLRRAAAAGRNFVITHEPTFYNHTDQTVDLEKDPTYQAKLRFIQDNNLVIFRFHDHAHALQPDPLVAGSARMLGWTQYASPQPRVYVLPTTTLRELAVDVAEKLKGRAIRIAGDPDMKVTRVALGPGYGVPALTPSIDVAVGGESAESGGNAEYILDAADGRPEEGNDPARTHDVRGFRNARGR